MVGDRINPLIQRRVELGDDMSFTVLADEVEKDLILL